MTQTVFVTGASGFIAKHIIVKLLNAGYNVRGSIRALDRSDEVISAIVPYVEDALDGRLEFVALDLGSDNGWDTALLGCDILMHTASPFPLSQPDNEDAVIRPAVEGTQRALRSAQAAGIKRVVLTSSSVSITNTDLPPGTSAYTEDHWSDPNHPTSTAYAKSKVMAELAAWEFIDKEAPDIALTVINPVFVLGPPLGGKYGTSIRVVERLLKAADPALPQFGFPCVDVRDIAEMHVRVLAKPGTAGKRYIGADRFMWFYEMAEILKAAYPNRKIVTRRAPNFVVRILALFDPAIKTVLPILGKREEVSSARAVTELDMTFRSADDALRDTADYLVSNKIV